MNRILIADDNAQNLYFLETMLKGYGYEVTSASNGEEALALALDNPPDMIITDILMPKMDGFELCRRFKANKVLQGIPFIFYTATYTDTRDEQFALSLGADRFVLKPQEPEALGHIIREVLNKTPEEKRSLRKPLGDEAEVLRHYNEVLFRKLEKKVLDLEQEIVSRERIAQELREKTEELDRYFNDALDLFCIADTDGRFRRLNKQWERTSGYPLEALQGKSLLEFTHPDDLKSTERTMARLGAREKVLNFVNRFRCEDGAYRCIEWSAVLYGDTMYAAARDITDRKMAEEALIKSESNYRELADSIADIFFAMDTELRCTYWNRASENFTGIKVQDAVGRHIYELFPRDMEKESAEKGYHEIARSGKPHSFVSNYRLNEKEYIFEVTSYPSQNGISVFAKDITAKRKIEDMLVITDRLVSVGELASGIAHEVNNPLTSIIGFAQMLIKENLPDEAKEYLAIIYDEAQRAAQVTKNLLTFARKHPPHKQMVCINEIIRKVLELRTYEQRLHHITVATRFADDLPLTNADYFQLQQVFLNIITNAEHALSESDIKRELTIATTKKDERILILIADNGPGIAAENLTRIFDPFFTTKEPGRGTGLGLSICHGIVTEHGGRIYAESKPGKGVTFIVELPVEEGGPDGE